MINYDRLLRLVVHKNLARLPISGVPTTQRLEHPTGVRWFDSYLEF